jgi:ferredoxin
MGTCSTCETKLLKGKISYEPEPFMEPEEGNIFICCAFPTGDIEIEL